MSEALVRAAPRGLAFAGVLALVTYSMSLSGRAALIVGLVALACAGIGVVVHATWWDVEGATQPDLAGRRRTWWSMILGAVLMGCGLLLVLSSVSTSLLADRVLVVATGAPFVLVGWSVFTGRLLVRLRHFRSVVRAHPTFRQWFIGLTVGGGMLLVFGLGGFSSVSGLRVHGVTTEAVVTDVTHVKGSSTYFLRYRVSGSRVVTCSTEDVLGDPERGSTIEVRYDSTDPSVNCQSADYSTGYGDAIGFTTAGSALLLGAAAGYLRVRNSPGA